MRLQVPKMRVKAQPKKLVTTCSICLEEYRTVELQTFHGSHRKHLACRICIDLSFKNLNSSVVKCPYCRLPVDVVLFLPFT